MINLDHREEKYSLSLDQLKPYGISPYRFSAINGWSLSLDTINEVGVSYSANTHNSFEAIYFTKEKEQIVAKQEKMHRDGRTYFARGFFKGSLGCVLSHLSVLQDAYDSGFETVWIMEDDIQVHKDLSVLPALIKELDQINPSWDILFTDPDTRNPEGLFIPARAISPRPTHPIPIPSQIVNNTRINRNFTKKKSRYGAYSAIFRRSGIKKLLDYFHGNQIFTAYDIDWFYVPDLQVYCLNYILVGHRLDAATDNAHSPQEQN